jgi:hypothetical protein
MTDVYKLRKRLIAAEIAYKSADSSLDSSPLQVIVCREELKNARFEYNEACVLHVEQLYFEPDGA